MSMILLGSRALKLRAPHLLARTPVDFDWICEKEEDFFAWKEKNASRVGMTKTYFLSEFSKHIVEGSTNCEFELTTPGSSNELIWDLVRNDPETVETPFGLVPSLDMLFTIKQSHRYKKFHNSAAGFWKTFFDWHAMRSVGARIRPEYKEFLSRREKESYAKQKHPNLMQSKDNFFSGDSVQYVVDHDSIHLTQKFFHQPAYQFYAKDNEPVFSDKKKFFECEEFIRVAGALEEVSTLAVERALLPSYSQWKSHKQAWLYAFSKAASTITSGWFRQYLYENGSSILQCFPENFFEKFKDGVRNNVVIWLDEQAKRNFVRSLT